MATSPTDKDEVQREEVDPAKTTEEEVNEEAIESSLNQNRQEDAIAIRTSGETMERGSTSFASEQQNPYSPCPYLGGIQFNTEEETFGSLGFSSTIYRSGQMMERGSASFASDLNRPLDSNPNTSAISLSIQDQATENQNRQEDSSTFHRSGETMGRGSISSASQQNRGLVPSGAQMSQQMMMPHPYQQERPVAHFQMPHPYQQEGSVAPFQMSQQMMMSHLRPSVPPYQQERPVAPVQNEFTQQRGKRKVYEAGESSSSRKRQNHQPGMSQQHLWQIEAPRDSEGYQEYLERLGGSSGGSLGAFSARHPLNQGRQNQPPWMNYNQPQQQAVRPVMNYNYNQQQQAARPVMNYNYNQQQQAVRPVMNYNYNQQQQAVRPWMNYNSNQQQQAVRPWMNYNYNQQQQAVRPVMNYNYHLQQQQFHQGQQRFRFPMNMIQHHQASPSAAVPPPPEQVNQQLQPQTQQPRQFQGSNADEPSSSRQGQG
ncbi:unnamed protein product [Brassica oleracea]